MQASGLSHSEKLGKKNCVVSTDDIQRVMSTYEAFTESETSKIFANEAFGYWKITVDRPLRLHSRLTPKAFANLRFASGDEDIRSIIYDELGDALFEDFSRMRDALERRLAD